MTIELGTALRQMMKSVVREVLDEVLDERQFQSHSRTDTPTHDDDPRFLLRAREAAKRLAISERHLHKLTAEGQIPCVRVGRLVHYSVSTIERWIRETESSDAPSLSPSFSESKAKPVTSSSLKRQKGTPRRQPKAKASHRASEQRSKPASKRQRKRSESQPVEERHIGPFDLLLDEIGVARDALPPLTNGDMMRIAEVDIPTLHGWQWHNRSLPDEALQRLKDHFAQYQRER